MIILAMADLLGVGRTETEGEFWIFCSRQRLVMGVGNPCNNTVRQFKRALGLALNRIALNRY